MVRERERLKPDKGIKQVLGAEGSGLRVFDGGGGGGGRRRGDKSWLIFQNASLI